MVESYLAYIYFIKFISNVYIDYEYLLVDKDNFNLVCNKIKNDKEFKNEIRVY